MCSLCTGTQDVCRCTYQGDRDDFSGQAIKFYYKACILLLMARDNLHYFGEMMNAFFWNFHCLILEYHKGDLQKLNILNLCFFKLARPNCLFSVYDKSKETGNFLCYCKREMQKIFSWSIYSLSSLFSRLWKW